MKRLKSVMALVLSLSMLLGSGEIPALAENYRDDVSGNMWEDVSTNDVSSSEIMENEEAEEILTDISACEDEKETEVLESIPEDVSSNDEYEIAVSDNDISFEEATFAGMPEGYELSDKQKQYALELEDCLTDIYGLEEGIDYAPGEVMLCTETEEEAELVARAYNGTLESYEYGVAVITLSGNNTVVHAVNACVKSATAPASSTLPVLPAVYPNYYMKTCSVVEDTTEETTEEAELPEAETCDADKLPSLDPDSNKQKYHEMIGDYHVWGKGYTGGSRFSQRVRVAVADTGIYMGHSELSDNCKGDGYGLGSPWVDADGHGTHLAGIVGAACNGSAGVGVAPETALLSMKIVDEEGNIDVASATAALNYVVYNAQYNNSSYFYKTCNIFLFGSGCYGYNSYLQEACTKAYNAGIVIFAPMGNDGCSARFYPACYKNVYGVAALTEAGTIASFSNYNKNASFAFPGVNIFSTDLGGTDNTPRSGTSQAAAIAAGVAADVLSCVLKTDNELEGKEIVDAVISTMKKGAKKSPDSGTGAGYVYLPTALGVITHASAPAAPIIDSRGITTGVNAIKVQLKSEEIFNTDIYFSTTGKAPVYKNGKCINGTKYTGNFSISGAKKITLQAIAVNPVTGLSSKVAKKTFKINTIPNKVTITASGITKSIKVLKGKSITLKAQVAPSYSYSTKVEWHVSPEGEGVKVKNGKVTVAKTTDSGTYIITAHAIDETTVTDRLKEKDYIYDGVYDTFAIEVVNGSEIESVSFDKTYKKFSLNKGTSMNLFPLVSVKLKGVENPKPGTTQYVAYVSSNPNIVSINNDGYSISTNGPGKATITAYATDGSGKKATCTITVTVPVTKLDVRDDLNLESGYASAGKSIKLKAITNADATVKKVKWEPMGDEDGKALSVSSSGKVTVKKNAKANGVYYVRALIIDTTTRDSSGEYKKLADSYAVNVIGGVVTSFSLNKKTFNLFTQIDKKKTMMLYKDVIKSYKLSSGNTGDYRGVEISNSNPEVVSVDGNTGKITALAPGKSKITITALDAGRKKASFTVNVLTPASDIIVEAGGGFARDVVYGSSSFEDIPVAEGGSIKLSARLEAKYGKISNTKVKWSVVDEDDKQYVKIDSSGKVTIKKVKPYEIKDEGAVTVRATMTDGSEMYCNYKIFTTEKTAKVTLTEVSKNKYRVKAYDKKGNEKSLINCRIEVADGVEITARNSNTFWFSVEKNGKYTVKITLLDGSGKTLKKKIELKE